MPGCGITVENLVDCNAVNIFMEDLTPEEVRACQCDLLAYTTALNEVEGITVSGGPPYVCGFVDCTPPPPQFINLSPTMATNFTTSDHIVTATVESDGIPKPDVLVTFEVISGPNAGLVSIPNNNECSTNDDCTTDGNGLVSWTYSSVIPGTDIIVASFFDENREIVIKSNTVEKIWVILPTNVPTLSEWGLIAMAGILGIVGFMVIRRSKLTA